MSSLVSGVTKIFSAVGTGLAKIPQAIRAVGASLFTAGGSSGSLFKSLLGTGSTIGNMFAGVKSVLGLSPLGAVGDAVASTATTLAGGLGAAVPGVATAAVEGAGTIAANTATGVAPKLTGFDKALSFANSDLASAALVGGGAYLSAKAQADAAEQARQDVLNEQSRKTNSYNVNPNSLVGSPNTATQPQVQTAQATTTVPSRLRTPRAKRWDVVDGKIVQVA
jgi:hypothetical protein